MNIRDEMYFSPSIKTERLSSITDIELFNAYKERILNWYILPSKELNEKEYGFASGLLLFSLIDALARYFMKDNMQVGVRFKSFLMKYFNFNQEISEIIFDNYRNGLVHQSQIKGNCYFSYLIGNIFFNENNVIMVNPKKLHEKLELIIENIFMNERENQIENEEVIERLRKDFV
jgi:hypothetical protein